MRLFVAIELSAELRRPLLDLIKRFRGSSRDVRWVSEAQLHITLKFLGEIEVSQLAAVRNVISETSAAISPFSITLHGVGGFPHARSPRVFWCGVDDARQSCRAWVERADPRFAELGVEPERRAFSPHITLARSNGPAGNDVLAEILHDPPTNAPLTMPVSEIVLFQSELLPTGARYTALLRAPLGPPRAENPSETRV